DDEEDARELLSTVLSAQGMEVTTADGADSALAMLNDTNVDVVVSDIGMPEHDGYWLLERLLERRPSLPVLALSAYSAQQHADRALHAGFVHYLPKPTEPEVLVRAIAAAVPAHAATAQSL